MHMFFKTLYSHLHTLDIDFELICINDGSKDKTLDLLVSYKQTYQNLRILNLSRNFGKEAALTAGLEKATGDAVIPIDADLQDPPELIGEMISKFREGHDVVLACRSDRSSDGIFKRKTAEWFYALIGKISDVYIPPNVGDYRLMSRRVVDVVNMLPETQRFMKGLFAWVGFNTTYIYYTRQKRFAGKTTFNFWSLWNFALEGITSFSTFPLRVWAYLGATASLGAFLYSVYIILKTMILGVDTPGYASTIVIIIFLGGIQLIGIGVIGEYIGRIYMESKRRPTYIIEDEQ